MKDLWKALEAAWLRVSGLVAFVAAIAGLLQWLKPGLIQVIVALVGFQIFVTVFLVFILAGIIERGFSRLETAIKGSSSAKAPGNPGHSTKASEGEQKDAEKGPKPSGAGAFAGMVAGAGVGLLFGPPGVLIGGIIGALLGNAAEYDTLKKRQQ